MTLSVTAVGDFSFVPRVSLEASSSPAVLGEIETYRVHPDGKRYRVLVGAGNSVISGTWSEFDYHAPFNTVVTYVVVVDGEESPESAGVYLPSDTFWMIHPSDPNLSFPVGKWRMEPFEFSYPSRAQSFDVIGRKLPVYQTVNARGGERGAFSVRCTSPEERVAVRQLVEDDSPILLNSPLEEIGWKWVQPGDVKLSNPTTFTQFPSRWATIPYVECEQPDLDVDPVWTIGELAAEAIAEVASTFEDIGHLTHNIRS